MEPSVDGFLSLWRSRKAGLEEYVEVKALLIGRDAFPVRVNAVIGSSPETEAQQAGELRRKECVVRARADICCVRLRDSGEVIGAG